MNSTSDVDKAVSEICKGLDKKEDAMTLMFSNGNWGHYLLPAPFTIFLLGEMMLISAGTDFSLEGKPPKDGFKQLRYPGSFRASLVQLCNAGWSAFNEAHTSMDQISLHSGNVDTHIKAAVQYLMQGSQAELQKMVPLSLNRIQNIADECLKLSKGIENKFIGVMELTGELLEVCTNAKGVYEEKNKETNILINTAKKAKENSELEKERAQQINDSIEKQVEEAHTNFKNEITNMPSSALLMGLAFGDGFVEGIKNMTTFPGNIVFTILNRLHGQPFMDMDHTSECDDEKIRECLDKGMSERKVSFEFLEIHKQIKDLEELASGKEDIKRKPSPDIKRIKDGAASTVKQSLERSCRNIENETRSGEFKNEVLDLCKDAIPVCDTLNGMVQQLCLTDEDQCIKKAIDRTQKLSKTSNKLYSKVHKMLGFTLENKSPHIAKRQNSNTSSSALQAHVETSRFKTELAKETLNDARQRQEKASEELRESSEKLCKIMQEMERLTLEEHNFDEIRKALVMGIKAIGEVKEQWSKLVLLFQHLATVIRCCFHTPLTDFHEGIAAGIELKIDPKAEPLSKIYRDNIIVQAIQASKTAYVIHKTSTAYVEISSKHLMNQIASLGRLVALDPTEDAQEIMQRKKELHAGCQNAHMEIESLINEENLEFNRTTNERIAKIKELEDSMPAIDPAKILEIQKNVSDAFTNDETRDVI